MPRAAYSAGHRKADSADASGGVFRGSSAGGFRGPPAGGFRGPPAGGFRGASAARPTPETTRSFFAPNQAPPATGSELAASVSRLRPRFGTILWGILLLTLATYMVVLTLLPVPPDPTLWLLGGVIAVGLGLVVAGIAAAARRAD